MSDAGTQPSIGDDPTAEDCRRMAAELRDEGLTLLPGRLEAYADALEAGADG